MKRIKYISCFFIMFLGMLIIGESHIFYINDFYRSFYNTSLYLQEDTAPEEMINDIVNSATLNKVDVFAYTASFYSTLYTEINIYGTPGVEEYIKRNKNIFEKKYTSLFCGSVDFKYNSIMNLPGIENIHDFYVNGNKEQVRQFKRDLVNKYAGNIPQEGHIDKSLTYNMVFIWLLITVTILLLSFYDGILQKKENVIKITMGEKIGNIVWKNIVLDSLVFSLIFIVITLSLSKVTYVYFRFNISLTFFLTLLFLNALTFFNLYFYNLKEVFSNTKIPGKLLSLNYLIKIITVIITIFIVSSNIGVVFESYKYYQQQSFFNNYKGYSYLQLCYKPNFTIMSSVNDSAVIAYTEKNALVMETFYREFFERFNATLIAEIYSTLGYRTIMANKNAFDYLSGEIIELREITLDKDIYFLLPRRLLGNTAVIDELNKTVEHFEGKDFLYDFDVIYYDSNVSIIAIDDLSAIGSNHLKNPVIIYNNTQANKLNYKIDTGTPRGMYTDDIMFKISDDEFNQFIEEHDLVNETHNKIDVFEKYENNWRIAKTLLVINTVLSVLFLLLEFIIISTVIKLEYQVNAIELSIKKVMGYSIFEKNKKIIYIATTATVLSVIIAFIIAAIIKLNTIYYFVYGGVIIFLLESFITLFYINKIEKASIQKILKGGNL